MNGHDFTFRGVALCALPSGALWWPAQRLLIVSDLHIGKARRAARFGGALLPPYEVTETLSALDRVIALTRPAAVVCLGDSFDDRLAGADLPAQAIDWIARMMAGRRWIWIEGNHDPGPVAIGGEHLAELRVEKLVFRHIAVATDDSSGEVSGHYHPKTRLAGKSFRCFLLGRDRLLLPAFGSFAGGLYCDDPALLSLFPGGGLAITTGQTMRVVPLASVGKKP